MPPRLEVDRDEARVPDVEPERDVVEREEVDRDFAAVAFPPLRPAAFFCAVVPPRLDVDRDVPVVERLRPVVERDELRDVPVFAREDDRDVPDVERVRLVVDRGGDAARARETPSSVKLSSVKLSSVSVGSPTTGGRTRSGVNPSSPRLSDSLSLLGSSK